MQFSSLLAALGLAGLAVSAPANARHSLKSRSGPGGLNVVYYGQNGGGTIENTDLSTYCTPEAGIDVIILSFLYEFGNGNTIPGGGIGVQCTISTDGGSSSCDALISQIATCQESGVKIMLSLGGGVGGYSLTSQSEAEAIGQYLWNAYGNSGNSGVTRPLGATVVDGWDFDIENPNGNEYYQYLISTLRSNFAKDTSKKYYITGAPQCPIPEPNMGVIISNSQFDYLWIQFYNNNNYTVPCALGINGDAPFNYNNWTSFISEGDSKNAKLFIGVPAAPLGANGGPAGEVYYATPSQLAQIVVDTASNSDFGGVMEWSAGFSDSNVNSGCTYAQEVKNILLSGAPCDGTAPTNTITPPKSTAPAHTATTSSPAGTSTSPPGSGNSGSVPQWGQCGGQGYTGPTQCQSPYKCVATGAWWSQCE